MAVVRTATQNIYGRRLWGRSAPVFGLRMHQEGFQNLDGGPGAGPGQRPCTHRDSHLKKTLRITRRVESCFSDGTAQFEDWDTAKAKIESRAPRRSERPSKQSSLSAKRRCRKTSRQRRRCRPTTRD